MKNLSKILFTVFIILFQIVGVNALSVDENNLTIEKGKNKSIDIYANVESEVTSIEFTMVYTTYDVPAYFIVNNAYTDTNPDGIKHNIVLNEPTSGKIKLGTININVVNNPKDTVGTINIHSGTAKTNNSESIKLNTQNINVSISNKNQQQDNNNDSEENQKEETHNLLERIESEIVKIELKEDLFEYDVTINKEADAYDNLADSISGVGNAAKDATRKTASFDDVIQISDSKSSSKSDKIGLSLFFIFFSS